MWYTLKDFDPMAFSNFNAFSNLITLLTNMVFIEVFSFQGHNPFQHIPIFIIAFT